MKNFTICGSIQLWNREDKTRSISECFNDGDISIQVAQFTYGMHSADYLDKEDGFQSNHEMLDILFDKFGTPTYYKYITNSSSNILQFTFEYKDFNIYVELFPYKTEDNLEYFNIQDIVFCGGNTLDLMENFEVTKTGTSRYTKTTDVHQMIEEFLKKQKNN